MKILLTRDTRNMCLIVLRTLVRNGHEPIVADDCRLPFGLHSRFVQHAKQVPHHAASDFSDALLKKGSKKGSCRVFHDISPHVLNCVVGFWVFFSWLPYLDRGELTAPIFDSQKLFMMSAKQ